MSELERLFMGLQNRTQIVTEDASVPAGILNCGKIACITSQSGSQSSSSYIQAIPMAQSN
jgi:hypothetical protein